MNNRETIVRIAVLAVTLINLILTAMGKNPLPVSSDEVYVALSSVAASAAVIWTAWKNNSVTPAAKVGDKVTKAIKSRCITAEEMERLLEAIKQSEKGSDETNEKEE